MMKSTIVAAVLISTSAHSQPTKVPQSNRFGDLLEVTVRGASRPGSSVAIVDLSIRNNAEFPLKDATIRCTFYGESGTRIGSASRTVYRQFKPKAVTNAKGINFGFVDQETRRVSCGAESAEWP